MDITIIKIIVLFMLFAVALICGFLPVILVQRIDTKSKRMRFILSALNCFSAGILMGTAFLHLLPDVRNTVEYAVKELGISKDYPFAELTASMGFILVMTIEQILAKCQIGKHIGKKEDQDIKLANLSKDKYEVCDSPLSSEDETALPSQILKDESNGSNILRCVVLFFAIASHTIFEGVAIGLQKKVLNVWSLLLAVSIHKAVLSFTLGLEFSQCGMGMRNVVILLVLFAFIAPVGIAVGIITINCASNMTSTLASGLLTGVATGTFFFVTFVEIMAEEMRKHPGIVAVLFVAGGFGISAALAWL